MRRNASPDIELNIATYLRSRGPADRYTSFDYCFNYFQTHRENGTIAHLASAELLEKSCLQLGFYLASWGMYRGSTELLRRSVRALAPAIRVIAAAEATIWDADAHAYSQGVSSRIVDYAADLRRSLPGTATDTLVTKVMLGVFGCVPAFDQQFRRGSGQWSFGVRTLELLRDYYGLNRELIEESRVETLDFATGEPTSRRYTRAKVLDMIFFVEGGGSPASAG
jgi:hypothetical protein